MIKEQKKYKNINEIKQNSNENKMYTLIKQYNDKHIITMEKC